jgi:uncharacterized protein (TIGR02266 family)
MAVSSETETPAVGGRQARKYDRIDASVEVTGSSQNTFWTGITRNVSRGGLFLVTDDPMPIGTILAFRLRLDTLPSEVEVRGIVRWIRPPSEDEDEDLPAGMGIQFASLDRAVELAIDAFIQSERDSLYFDTDDDL